MSFLEDMSIELRSNHQFFIKIVQFHGGSLQSASEQIKTDTRIVIESIKVILISSLAVIRSTVLLSMADQGANSLYDNITSANDIDK